MALLSTSILAADFANLGREVAAAQESGADWIHVDVMDGLFVPNLTVGIPVVRSLRRATALPLDVHLMIDRPIRYVDAFCDAGADYLTIHIEADTPAHNLEALTRIAARGVKAAISLKPGTSAEAAKPYLGACAMVLVMTVEPGFGGQSFLPEQMAKLRTLRAWAEEMHTPLLLEVDGGVNLETAAACKQSGADVLVAGSAFFRASDKAAFARAVKQP